MKPVVIYESISNAFITEKYIFILKKKHTKKFPIVQKNRAGVQTPQN